MLIANHITCIRSERTLFEDLTIQLLPGNIFQIVGENGAGKSSLLRILVGLLKPTSGEVIWNRQSIERNSIHYHQSLFYLGHATGIKQDLTVHENIIYSLNRVVYTATDLQFVLQMWSLTAFEHVICRRLSQGQRQRVALAILTLSRKQLWFLDEPFSSLDIEGTSYLLQLFQQHSTTGGSIVFTTHRSLEWDGYMSTVSL